MAKHAEQVSKGRLILMAVAAIALVGIIIVTAVAIVGNRKPDIRSAAAFIESIHSFQDLDVAEDAKPVTAVQKCLDVTGDTLAYAVTAYGEGFADRISVRCFFELDKKTLIGIEVLEHAETKGIGDKVAASMYTQRFEFKKMPIWFNDCSVPEEELPKQKGTRVDTISEATVSCRAVVDAVNAAYAYYADTRLK